MLTKMASSISTTLGILLEVARNNLWRVVLSSLCLVLVALLDGIGVLTLLPLLVVIVDSNAGTQSGMYAYYLSFLEFLGLKPTLGVFLALLVCIIVVKTLISALASLQVSIAQADIIAEHRKTLLRSFLGARWEYFVAQPSGRMANAISQEAQQAGALYTQLCDLIASFLQGLVYLTSALLLSWQITLGASAVGLAMLAVLSGLIARARVASMHQTELMSSFSARLVDSLGGIKPLKAMGVVDRVEPLLSWEVNGLRTVYARLLFLKKILTSAQEVIRVIALAIALYWLVQHMHYPFETLMVITVLFIRTLDVFRQVQNGFQTVATLEFPHQHVQALCKEAESLRDHEGGGRYPTLVNSIEFRNVSFAYGSKGVFQNSNFRLPAGQFICVVGPSGEGKTTLLDLVIGLLRPQAGKVLIDDIPLDELDRAAWRHGIGYVPQEVFLFHDTLLRNVTLGDPRLSEDDAEQALKAAGAWEFVSGLEHGLHTKVGERGGKLSGGQRQRISIARALVRKPRLLVLDEATNALNGAIEADIVRALRTLTPAVTILAITHGHSLVEHADVVFTLQEGDVQQSVKTAQPAN